MAIKHLIDLSYEIAKEEYGSKEFTFNKIYNSLTSKPIANYPQLSIGELYQEMLQDSRFIYVGNEE
jgi:DNA-directed RNA polymerase delta subunit